MKKQPRPGIATAIVALALLMSHGVLVSNAGADQRQARLMLQIGLNKSAGGDRQGAIEAYSRAIAAEKGFAEAYVARGLEWSDAGDLDKAIADFDTAIRLDPRHFVAYANRSWCHSRKGNLRQAFADIDVADRLQPGHPKIAYQRGGLLFKSGEYAAARQALERSLELNPGYAPTYADLGSVYNRLGDFRTSLAHFARAIELDPRYVDAWRNRALTKRDMGDLVGAIADFTRAIRLDPDRAEFRLYRGKIHYDLQQHDQALADLRRHCALAPADQDYTRLYIWLALTAGGDREAAAKDLQTYIRERKAPSQASMTDWYPQVAGILLGSVGADAALAVAAATPDEATRRGRICEAHFYAGAVKQADGDTAGAAESFRRSIETDRRDFLEYRSARAMLARTASPEDRSVATADER